MDLNFFTDSWWERVDRSDSDGCWPWLQSTGSHGYGQTWDGSTVVLAHRVAWALHHGHHIPDGQTLHHTCYFKPCCNPAHLVVLSNEDNSRDNAQSRRTHCPRGHAYDETNTYVDPKGHRRCRACARITRHERSLR